MNDIKDESFLRNNITKNIRKWVDNSKFLLKSVLVFFDSSINKTDQKKIGFRSLKDSPTLDCIFIMEKFHFRETSIKVDIDFEREKEDFPGQKTFRTLLDQTQFQTVFCILL